MAARTPKEPVRSGARRVLTRDRATVRNLACTYACVRPIWPCTALPFGAMEGRTKVAAIAGDAIAALDGLRFLPENPTAPARRNDETPTNCHPGRHAGAFGIAAIAVESGAQSSAGRKPRVAVLDFDYATVQSTSAAMSEMMSTLERGSPTSSSRTLSRAVPTP